MNFDYQEILNFWFEGLTPETPLSSRIPIVKKWFKADADFDHLIREKFGQLFEVSILDALIQRVNSPQERLAKIILLDQFPRNIYRGTPKMYAFDALALKLSDEGLSKNEDQALKLYERIFFYMPFMHSEDLRVQERSLILFEKLYADAKKEAEHNHSYFALNLKYAKEHYDVIKTFSRFPHRNSILRRTSTTKEEIYLKRK